MCDYCDCRSHPQIAALSADHEILLGLLRDLERAVNEAKAERARALMSRLQDLLGGHAAREERGVFTELRRAGVDDGYVAEFEHDHEQIHALLGRSADADWQPPACELARLLADHIAREETDLFPAAHQLLAPGQWDAVDAALAELTT